MCRRITYIQRRLRRVVVLVFATLLGVGLFAETWPHFGERTGFAAERTVQQALDVGKQRREKWPPAPPVDENVLKTVGIRTHQGRHLLLYTDLAARDVNPLPAIFDEAVPLWGRFFGVDVNQFAAWQVTGCIIENFDQFRPTGLVTTVPNLRNGYSLHNRIWLRSMDTMYYRTHLLLHEGVHAFMEYHFGTCGPIWYQESVAELLATHRIVDGKLQLAIMPANREEVPMWGRIKYFQEAVKNTGKHTPNDTKNDNTLPSPRKTMQEVMALQSSDLFDNESYAWCWGLAIFLMANEETRTGFRELARDMTSGGNPTQLFLQRFDDTTLAELEVRWMDFVRNVDYGYDFARTRITDLKRGTPLADSPHIPQHSPPLPIVIQADRGWQNSGVFVEKGTSYRITADGRFTLGDTPRPWESDARGVTVRYHQNRPLGQLLATVLRYDDNTGVPTTMSPEFSVGTDLEWDASETGTLFFRINESPAELFDNRGRLAVYLR